MDKWSMTTTQLIKMEVIIKQGVIWWWNQTIITQIIPTKLWTGKGKSEFKTVVMFVHYIGKFNLICPFIIRLHFRNDINRKMTSNSAVDLNDLYTRRAHHSGVLSGHELLSYSFLGGQACEPRRSIRRKHRSRLVYIVILTLLLHIM